MNATDHPLVTAYLDAVARETAELPAERRAELLADLREHVEVSGAVEDDQVREVLAALGEPRTVAASALAEEPAAAAPTPAGRPWRARLTVVLLALAGLLVLFNAFLGTAALIAGLALLWSSPLWDTRRKVIGTLACAAAPFVVVVGALTLSGSRIGPTELLLIATLSLAVPVAGALALLRAVRR
ncbi:HAAS signaling domain-containing protein [Streptomyces sp. NPDC013740]|uniref:HAAS signaling domain-containing protein n=1 Tax=Streptomyces sp. NPDC013740 TaxID=3364867 RepID=UPI0036F69F4E